MNTITAVIEKNLAQYKRVAKFCTTAAQRAYNTAQTAKCEEALRMIAAGTSEQRAYEFTLGVTA